MKELNRRNARKEVYRIIDNAECCRNQKEFDYAALRNAAQKIENCINVLYDIMLADGMSYDLYEELFLMLNNEKKRIEDAMSLYEYADFLF